MKGNILISLIVGLAIVVGGLFAAAQVDAHFSLVKICHATGSGNYNSIIVNHDAIGGHFFNNGTPKAGHEDDILLQSIFSSCPSPSPSPTPSPSPSPSPEPCEEEEYLEVNGDWYEPSPTPCPSPDPSPDPSPSPEPSPTPVVETNQPSGNVTTPQNICNGVIPSAPMAIGGERIDSDTVLLKWLPSTDSSVVKQILNYGYSADSLVYGVDNLPKNSSSLEVNGVLDNTHVFFKVIAETSQFCQSESQTVDP